MFPFPFFLYLSVRILDDLIKERISITVVWRLTPALPRFYGLSISGFTLVRQYAVLAFNCCVAGGDKA